MCELLESKRLGWYDENSAIEEGAESMKCKYCGEELLIDHEIQAGECMTCMMIMEQEDEA